MDKKSESILLEAEATALEAEGLPKIADGKSLADAIKATYQISRQIDALTFRRTLKNKTPRARMNENTAWFKPMIDRLDKSKGILREAIQSYVMPSGKPGNLALEDLRAYGTGGVGVASFAEIPQYDYDIKILAELHPHLLKVDETEIRKLIKQGKMPQGVTPRTDYQLRIG